MAQKRRVKCPVCEEYFDINSVQGVRFSINRYAHEKCAPDKPWIPIPGHIYTEEEKTKLETEAPKAAETIKKPAAKEDKPKSERVQFTDYVQELFGKENCNWGIIAKQMKQYIEEYHYTYSGMQKTLEWYYNVQKKPKNNKNGGIGIIPYNYRQAYNYYYKIYAAQELNANVEKNELKVEEIKVIKKPRANRKIKLIDMEEFDEK